MSLAERTVETTAPIIEGGAYEFTHADGRVETGTIMGTTFREGAKRGWLYTFSRGAIPDLMTENRQIFAGWTLVAAPSQGAGKTLAGQHKAKTAEANKDKLDAAGKARVAAKARSKAA